MTESVQYPIGRADRSPAHTAPERELFTARLAALPAALAAAISGFSDADFDTPYRDGGWTVRQLVHHVADSHANAFIRLKLALTEDEPTIKPYDQDAWSTLADVSSVSPLVSLAMIAAVHERFVAVIRAMDASHYARTLMHPENGRMTVDQLIAMYAWHGDHHVAHIRGMRASKA